MSEWSVIYYMFPSPDHTQKDWKLLVCIFNLCVFNSSWSTV